MPLIAKIILTCDYYITLKKTLQMCGPKLTKVTVIPPVLPLELVFHGSNFYTATHPRTSKEDFLKQHKRKEELDFQVLIFQNLKDRIPNQTVTEETE